MPAKVLKKVASSHNLSKSKNNSFSINNRLRKPVSGLPRSKKIPSLTPIKDMTFGPFFNHIGAKSIPGYAKGIRKLNQDTFLISESISDEPELALLAVYDGHGMFGNRVSNFLKRKTKGIKTLKKIFLLKIYKKIFLKLKNLQM